MDGPYIIDDVDGERFRLNRSVLVDAFSGHLVRYRSNRGAALQLVSAGQSARDQTLDIAELAAYQMVASLILNLDATITKD